MLWKIYRFLNEKRNLKRVYLVFFIRKTAISIVKIVLVNISFTPRIVSIVLKRTKWLTVNIIKWVIRVQIVRMSSFHDFVSGIMKISPVMSEAWRVFRFILQNVGIRSTPNFVIVQKTFLGAWLFAGIKKMLYSTGFTASRNMRHFAQKLLIIWDRPRNGVNSSRIIGVPTLTMKR